MPAYCMPCSRYVEPQRKLGAGFWILAICTGFFSALFWWAWPKRCPLCNGQAWGTPLR